jgi:hypothetical protein
MNISFSLYLKSFPPQKNAPLGEKMPENYLSILKIRHWMPKKQISGTDR